MPPQAGAVPAPVSGLIAGRLHRYPVRVYFEDTDLSGIVYHANYLRFMERARSDLLRLLGIDQRGTHDRGEGVYAVAGLEMRYLAPARLDDELLVETRCVALGAATVSMRQTICRGDRLLTDATVRAGFLSADGRPQRQPADWRARFQTLLTPDGDDKP
jgi:acyl-CoA thioester hydrolase